MDTHADAADRITATIADQITESESLRFRSSVLIDMTAGLTEEAAILRAFSRLWTSRLGYASHLSDAEWAAIQRISVTLGL